MHTKSAPGVSGKTGAAFEALAVPSITTCPGFAPPDQVTVRERVRSTRFTALLLVHVRGLVTLNETEKGPMFAPPVPETV
jgi:hypothetical protein